MAITCGIALCNCLFYSVDNEGKDPFKKAKPWEAAQDLINLDNQIKFLKTHHLKCKINEHNFTNNVSTRCIPKEDHEHLADFATGSLWNPYVTTVGLYDDNHELLVVGKLGQPVRMSDETDTTFILRWDT